MPMVNFVGETYTHRSRNVSPQRTLNLYPEIISNEGAKSKYILVGTPGSSLYSDLSDISSQGCRGLHYTSTGVLYSVIGTVLSRINSDGTRDYSWTISGLSSYVSMADNGKFLMIADGQNLWKLNMDTDSLVTENALPFTEPLMVKYIGQRFVSFGRNSNQFWWSDVGPDGPANWSGLGFASAEGSADYIISMGVTDGELLLLGPRSYEVFRISADPYAPFSKVGGSNTNIGCGAPWSVAEIMGTVFFLGSSSAGKNQIYQLSGYQATPISNPAISYTLDRADVASGLVSTTSDGVGFAYQQEGHMFYVLTFRQANFTICYDATTNQWHDRSSHNAIINTENFWDSLFCVYAYDRIITGTVDKPVLLELSLSTYTEYDGRYIKRQRISPIYWDDLGYLNHQDLMIDIETGVGLADSSLNGHNPKAMLRYSDDNGNNWSSERWRDIGPIGTFLKRCRWNKLGVCRNRVYELTIFDPVKVVILGASMRAVKSNRR